jgi:hypothetical protein
MCHEFVQLNDIDIDGSQRVDDHGNAGSAIAATGGYLEDRLSKS